MGIMLRSGRLKTAGLVLAVAVFGSVAYGLASGKATDGLQVCLSVDATDDSSTICGTDQHVQDEMTQLGRDWAARGQGTVDDPVKACVARSVVQAGLNGWPEQYRRAFEEGCRS